MLCPCLQLEELPFVGLVIVLLHCWPWRVDMRVNYADWDHVAGD
jgi:hypothetical protein